MITRLINWIKIRYFTSEPDIVRIRKRRECNICGKIRHTKSQINVYTCKYCINSDAY